MNPGSFTLRELVRMAEGRNRAEWSRTSAILALTYNVNRGPDAPVKSPADFDPYTVDAPKPRKVRRGIRLMASIFGAKGAGK